MSRSDRYYLRTIDQLRGQSWDDSPYAGPIWAAGIGGLVGLLGSGVMSIFIMGSESNPALEEWTIGIALLSALLLFSAVFVAENVDPPQPGIVSYDGHRYTTWGIDAHLLIDAARLERLRRETRILEGVKLQ